MPVVPSRVIALFLCALAIVVIGGREAAAQPTDPATSAAPAGDASRGKTLFFGYGCYECHGTAGQGNFTTAPRLAPHALPNPAFLVYIRKPSGVMPSYSTAILPDRDANDIYAFLLSIGGGKPAAQIPLLAGTSLKSK